MRTISRRRDVPGPERDFGEGELDLALRQADCPACLLSRETESAMLAWMAKVNIREPETVRRLVATRGLCGPHWSAVSRLADGRMSRAVRRALVEVGRSAIDEVSREGFDVGPRCPVCTTTGRRADSAIQMILGRLAEPSGRSAFARSFGLCQPHLSVALRLGPGGEVASVLLSIQRTQLEHLVQRLEAGDEDEAAAERATRLVQLKLAGST